MKKTATTIRCVPRYGFSNTQVRLVDLDLPQDADERELLQALEHWFSLHGLSDAVYDIDVDDEGYFAIINDEVFERPWGTPLL
jgi:hypothetical protein